MKKLLKFLFVMFFVTGATAQEVKYKMNINFSDGKSIVYNVSDIKDITFLSDEEVPVEPAYYYIDESFATEFGVFAPEESLGEYPWVIDYSTAKATSYDSASKTDNAAISWLVSSPVDFTNETEACVSFEYIIRYAESGKVAENHQLLVSSDYAGEAADATWVNIPYDAVEGTDWQTFAKASVAVPAEFMGKKNVVFALRYTAESKAGTWEVKNFKVQHGKPEEGEEEKPEDAVEYTVSEALAAFTGAAKPAIVKGYIVGSVKGQVYEEGCIFSATTEANTNLLIADTPEETDHSKCMPVQLPSGAVRSALNLVDNPGNYKKQVTLTGSLEKYFGVPGLKAVSKYVIDGVTPEEPGAPADAYISESFATEFGVFAPEESLGEYPWVIDYSTAKATSYDGTDNAAISWLVSSPVDFTNETEACVSFEYIIRYAESGKVAENHQLLVSSDYAGEAADATWVNIPYDAVEGTDWQTFAKASVAVPAEFMGKKNVVFALRYTAETKSGTWEVKNFKVQHGKPEAGEPVVPEEVKEYTVSDALAAFTGVAKPAIVKGYIVGTIDGMSITDGAVFSGTATTATNLLIADTPDETDCNNCMPVQLPSGAVRSALNLIDNPGNYKKFVTLTGSLEKYFGVAGLKAVSKYVIDGVTPEEPETPADAYISESFATEFGVFAPEESLGEYPWVIDYSTAKATSYDSASKTDNAAISWLVSSPVDFTNETEACVSFEYIIRYAESGKVAENHQLLVSSDYAGEAADATWVNIPYDAVEGTDWQTFAKASVAVPAEFMGKKNIVFALRYTAETKSGTWEVKNFKVQHGKPEAGEPVLPEVPETPVVPEGDSLIANPGFESWNGNVPAAWGGPAGHNATIAQSTDARTGEYSIIVSGTVDKNVRLTSQTYKLNAGTYTFSVYVKANGADKGFCRLGYVPVVDGAADSKKYTYETAQASAVTDEWTARVYEFTLAEDTEIALIVMNNKLSEGASFLVDDAQLVTADGGVTEGGEGEEGGEEQPETPAEGEYLNEPFADSLGSFTTTEVVGTYAWSVDASYHHAKVSGYSNGASQDAESWLVSPAIDLSNETAANIVFDYVINKGDASLAAANHKLLVTSDYTGNVSTTEWTEVEYGAVNNDNWTFNNTGEIALPAAVMGKSNVVIAFKYMSTTENSSTWEVKNLIVSSAAK